MGGRSLMDAQHEVWAEALWIEQHKGDDAASFIAHQTAQLMLEGDDSGVARWQRIAAAYEQLRAGRSQ